MSDIKITATGALRLLFKPIARILIRAGVHWREVADICRLTYVEVATEDFGVRGRPTNVSRVAILTGLTRRDVSRLRKELENERPQEVARMNYATRVLSGWYQDADFLGSDGFPRTLPVSGSRSFEALCRKYSADVAPSTMLKELKHVGAIEEDASGRLVAKSRVYMPALMDPEQMVRSGGVLQDIGDTVAYNLHRIKEQPSRFERRATNTRIPADVVPAFRDFIEREGQAFLERVDTWLTDHESAGGDRQQDIRLGLGAYWIEQTIHDRQQ